MGNLCGNGNANGASAQVLKPVEESGQMAKLLLLGSGESGKSTVFKQIKKLHNPSGEYPKEELVNAKSAIYANILHSIRMLADGCHKYNMPLAAGNEERAQRIIDIVDNNTALAISGAATYTTEVADDVKALWNDPAIREMFSRRYEFHVFDGAEYFFSDLDRLNPPAYVPTFEDILRCRMKTVGIIEIAFKMGDFTFKLFDVGGQRNERKKWIHHFEGVTAVIFVVSMSDYDQKCYEDDMTNRMQESLEIFEETINGTWFKNTPIMLFMNKLDVFKEKIQKTDLKQTFPDYNGGCNFEPAAKFIEQKFRDANKSDPGRIYAHQLTATSTDAVRDAFEKVKKTVIDGNLHKNRML